MPRSSNLTTLSPGSARRRSPRSEELLARRASCRPRRVHAADRGRGWLGWLAISAAGAALAILAGLAAL